MGYLTQYSLIHPLYGLDIDELEKLEEVVGFDPFVDEFEKMKWYEWEGDMKTLSESFPDRVYGLSGQGEDPEDRWVAYFNSGKSVVHRMPEWIPPAYKESDLQ